MGGSQELAVWWIGTKYPGGFQFWVQKREASRFIFVCGFALFFFVVFRGKNERVCGFQRGPLIGWRFHGFGVFFARFGGFCWFFSRFYGFLNFGGDGFFDIFWRWDGFFDIFWRWDGFFNIFWRWDGFCNFFPRCDGFFGFCFFTVWRFSAKFFTVLRFQGTLLEAPLYMYNHGLLEYTDRKL